MKGTKTRWIVSIITIAVVMGGLFLPFVPVTKSLTIPLWHQHGCSSTYANANLTCAIRTSYSIKGMASISYLAFGIGNAPFSNPYQFVTNDTYYEYVKYGSNTLVQPSPTSFVKSPLVFTSIRMTANGTAFNGYSLTFQVRNDGNTRVLGASIDIGDGWTAVIPALTSGQTFNGNSTGWLNPPPRIGSTQSVLLQGVIAPPSAPHWFNSAIEIPVA